MKELEAKNVITLFPLFSHLILFPSIYFCWKHIHVATSSLWESDHEGDMCSQGYFSSGYSNPKCLFITLVIRSVQILDCLFNIMSLNWLKSQPNIKGTFIMLSLESWLDILCLVSKLEDNYKKLMIEYLQFYWGQMKWTWAGKMPSQLSHDLSYSPAWAPQRCLRIR